MKLQIINFRCFKNITFDFNKNTVNVISGNAHIGVGKTSLLDIFELLQKIVKGEVYAKNLITWHDYSFKFK